MKGKQISSRENPLYKELKLLATSSQTRRKAGRTLLDGIHLCDAYLAHVGEPLVCVFGEGARENDEAGMIIERCEAGAAARCVELPDALFKPLRQVENGLDLLFVIDTPLHRQPEALARNAVLLDNVQDPGNVGSILRSAAAAGLREIYCGRGTAFAWSPKVLRAGMAAHFMLRIFEDVDLEPLIESATIPVVATSSHADEELYDLDLRRDVAWLFGNEGQGVSERLLEKATKMVVIPHFGEIESMNVAASAAVCFFEQVRQLKKNGKAGE